jgi:plasmid stabilization system protein ParE
VPRDNIRPGLRLAVHGRYNIYFRVAAAETTIVRVLHSARDVRRISFDDQPS